MSNCDDRTIIRKIKSSIDFVNSFKRKKIKSNFIFMTLTPELLKKIRFIYMNVLRVNIKLNFLVPSFSHAFRYMVFFSYFPECPGKKSWYSRFDQKLCSFFFNFARELQSKITLMTENNLLFRLNYLIFFNLFGLWVFIRAPLFFCI